MSHIDADRVLESSTTTGAGNVTLSGAVPSYRSLASLPGMVDGTTVDLYIEDVLPASGVPTGLWECGTYTWRTGGILERTTIRGGSSGPGVPVNWGVGLRRIGMGLLAYMIQAIRSVNGSLSDVQTVSAHIGNVDLVATHIGNVDAVAGDIARIDLVANDLANVDIVAGAKANVDTVAGNVAAVNSNASNIAAIVAAGPNAAISSASALTAIAQAGLSAAYAIAASSVAAQDLSGVAAGTAFHRGPNAIVDKPLIYETRFDRDGGAWVGKVDVSYLYETLNGPWVTAAGNPTGISSELAARALGGTLGSELVTNGAFSTNTAGWTPSICSIASVGGQLQLTTGGNFGQQVTQSIATVSGQAYVLTGVFNKGTCVNTISVSTSASGSPTATNGLNTQNGFVLVFVASGATTSIVLSIGNNETGTTAYFDSISCKAVMAFAQSGSFYQDATDGKFKRLWKNLLKQSDDASTWTRNAVNFSQPTVADHTGANRVVNLVTDNAVNSAHSIDHGGVSCFSLPASGSLLVKPFGACTRIAFGLHNGGQCYGYFDISAGTVTATAGANVNVASVTIAAAGNGWWRITNGGSQAAGQASSVDRFFLLPCQPGGANNTVYAGTGNDGFYFYNSQVTLGLTPDTVVEAKAGTDLGQTETFRGNKARFPRVAGIVVEATRAVIYDLLEPGRPMWMVIASTGAVGGGVLNINGITPTLSAAAAGGGKVVLIGGSASAMTVLDFARDDMQYGSNTGGTYTKRRISERHSGGFAVIPGGGYALPSITLNAVAMATMPEAPVDPATGLPAPTIAVGTGGGLSLIQHDGSVVSPTTLSGVSIVSVALNEYTVMAGSSTSGNLYVPTSPTRPSALASGTAFTTMRTPIPQLGASGGVFDVSLRGRGTVGRRNTAGAQNTVEIVMWNEVANAASLVAQIAPTYTTGWMNGGTIRCLFADTTSGAVAGTVADRSYKGATATVFGAGLTRVQVGAGSQLCFTQGFSATSYVQEAYSADYDFASGFALPMVLSIPAGTPSSNAPASGGVGPAGLSYLPMASFPATSVAIALNTAQWAKGTGWAATGAGTATCDGTQVATSDLATAAAFNPVAGTFRRWTITVTAIAGVLNVFANNGTSFTITAPGTYTSLGTTANATIRANAGTTCSLSLAVDDLGLACANERSAAGGGASWKFGIRVDGALGAELVDSAAAPRNVYTTASYSGAGTVMFEPSLSPSGSLTLRVGGKQVAQTTGAPLATMANGTAVVTWGQSRLLNAPFPGGIALARPTSIVNGDDHADFVWIRERAMFRDGAQVTLPDAGVLTNFGVDAQQERWLTVSAANSAEFFGLVRVSSAAAAAGSISKSGGSSGMRLLARTGVNPGVDITLPAQNLKEELAKAENAALRMRGEEMYDWLGGFTAAESTGSTQLSSATPSVPMGSTIVGAQCTANAGFAGTRTIAGWNGSTGVTMDGASTATSAVTVTFTDFILPPGAESRDVFAGTPGSATLKQEGGSKDYTRLFDGIRERVRFITGPGAAAHVRINARRMAA